jgi:hypothetical protein
VYFNSFINSFNSIDDLKRQVGTSFTAPLRLMHNRTAVLGLQVHELLLEGNSAQLSKLPVEAYDLIRCGQFSDSHGDTARKALLAIGRPALPFIADDATKRAIWIAVFKHGSFAERLQALKILADWTDEDTIISAVLVAGWIPILAYLIVRWRSRR